MTLLFEPITPDGAFIVKRGNSYGDEAVTPAPAATPAETPAPAPAPAEEAPKAAEQPAPCGEAKTEASGYRAKRSNSYGDEAVTPAAAPAETPAPAPAPAEEAPKAAEQPAPCGEAKTEASGYRAKRSNSYGDEAVTPAPAATPAETPAPAPAPAEEAPKAAEQPAPCGEAKTEASGYRAKRSNSYGDEAVTPAPAATPAETPAPAPAPAEEAPKAAEQPAPCGEAKTEASGYRAKRSNSYGDEAVTPAAAPAETPAPAPAPAEEAPKAAEQPAPCGEAKTEASGYRAKRSNSYGDEAVTPAPAATPAETPAPAPAPAEEAPKAAEQPAPCGEAKTEASGYRAKRSNSYGDEAVTPAPAATPAETPAPAPAPAEEAPKAAEQPAPCGEGQDRGFRLPRLGMQKIPTKTLVSI
ncbi:unnamed protein product, partial [Mesorhabditis spiculigera]